MGTINKPSDVQILIKNLPETTLLCLDEAYIDFVDDNFVPKISLETKNVIRMKNFFKSIKHQMSSI